MQGSSQASRPLLWALAAAAALLLLAALVEATGLVYFASTRGGLFYTASLPPEADLPSAAVGNTALHPYYGFAIRPGTRVLRFDDPAASRAFLRDPERPPEWVKRRSNNFGFYHESDYPLRDPDAYLVGIFGGSFAHSLALQSGDRLAERLSGAPPLAGRKARVLNFASGGYKQPQQLLILAYFLALGQRLDVVVNVDGFNEAVFGSDNLARGVDSSMPAAQLLRGLRARASAQRDPEALRQRLALAELRAEQAALRELRAGARLAAGYLWADLRLRRTSARIQQRVREPAAPTPRESLLWVAPALPDHGDPTRKIAAEWLRASTLMAALAEQAGAGYLHVLQPNQYASARRFGEAERRIALDPAAPYGAAAEALYPVLRRSGAELAAAGVDFFDATGVLDDEPGIVYADDCCHLNQRGTDLFADHVADRLANQLTRRLAAAQAEGTE